MAIALQATQRKVRSAVPYHTHTPNTEPTLFQQEPFLPTNTHTLPTNAFFTPLHGVTFCRWLQHKISIPLSCSTTLSLKGHIPLQAPVWSHPVFP